jgi:hypothetical protein
MSRTVVGRIFWKELRAQRSLWLGVTCLVVVIQALLTASTLYYGHQSLNLQEFCGRMFLAAYLGAAFYAIGSGAASFTEEIEGNTASLLRTVPMTSAEAFAGKWGYGLASTGVLFVVLAAVAQMCSWIASTHFHSGETFELGAEFGLLFKLLWIGVLIPIVLFAFCTLFSLLLSEGLIAGLCGAASTILALVLVGIPARGPTGSLASSAMQLSFVAAALVATDFWLTGIWLRRGAFGRWKWGAQFAGELTRWSWFTTPVPGPIELLRFGEPVVPWRRAVQRLVWKEGRQARPYVEICAAAATVMAIPPILDPQGRIFGRLGPWVVVLAAPLLMGVGAYHADQKGRGYRFLADRALPTDGLWFVKHVVWFGLTLAICGYAVLIDQIGSRSFIHDAAFSYQDSILYAMSRSVARVTPGYIRYDPTGLAALGGAGFYALLAYSIGQRTSFAISKGILAFGLTMGATLIVSQVWTMFAFRGVPIWWTIGAVPPVLLAYTLTHTDRWQTQRLYSYRWYLVALWMVLPLAGIVLALCVYWPFPVSS